MERSLPRHPVTGILVRAASAGVLAVMLGALPAPGLRAQARVALAIVSPASGETVHDNQGKVRVTVSARGLPAGMAVAFRPLVDGAPHGPDQRAPSFLLADIDRGEHVLQVLLVDGKGEVVAASQPLTFHVWRASALFPVRKVPPPARPVP